MKPKSRPLKQTLAAAKVLHSNSQKVHYKKGRSTKAPAPAARPKPDAFRKTVPGRRSTKAGATPPPAPELGETLRKRNAVLPMPLPPAVEAQDHAQRVAAHRRRLDEIHTAYRESTADVFNEPGSLAEKQKRIRKNMRQLAKALGDCHVTALQLLDEGQQAALLQMLPDFKGGRWLN